MTIDITKEPKDFYEAFKNALVLHITAPTKEQSNEALYIAESFSENLTEEDILKAKHEVDVYLDELDKVQVFSILLKDGMEPITYTIKTKNVFWFDEEKGLQREIKYCKIIIFI